MVYTAMYADEKVAVKSAPYSKEYLDLNNHQAVYVNYLNEEKLDVAYYIDPFVETSDDQAKIVTVSRFLDGYVAPEALYNVDSLWWSDEYVVRTLGIYLANFRLASAKFAKEHKEEYETFPKWDEIGDGWQTQFTPITIPVTEESFGLVHGDLHTGNWMIKTHEEQLMDLFDVAALDFDNAQRSWYVVDIGTVLFMLNEVLYPTIGMALSMDAYEAWFYQFKGWLVDSYEQTLGFNVSEDDLQQGCRWRKDFMYQIWSSVYPYVDPESDDGKALKGFIDLYESGNMPNC